VLEHVHTSEDLEATRRLLHTIADGDRELAEKLWAEWDKGRSPQSAAKRELIFGLQLKDQLLYQWRLIRLRLSRIASASLLQAATRA
jgi:hypothetical protein